MCEVDEIIIIINYDYSKNFDVFYVDFYVNRDDKIRKVWGNEVHEVCDDEYEIIIGKEIHKVLDNEIHKVRDDELEINHWKRKYFR